MSRRRLSDRRLCETFSIPAWGNNFHVTVGYYPDGNAGEIFIAGSRSGVDLDAVCRDSAILLSIAMQFGVPLEVIRDALTRDQDGSPSTIIGAIVDRLAPRESERLQLLLTPKMENTDDGPADPGDR